MPNYEHFRYGSTPYAGNPEFLTIADPAAVAAFDAFLDVFNPDLKGYGQYVIGRNRGITGETIGVEAIGMKLSDPVDPEGELNPGGPIIEGGAGQDSGKGS